MEGGRNDGWTKLGDAARGVLADRSARRAKETIKRKRKERGRERRRRHAPWEKARRA